MIVFNSIALFIPGCMFAVVGWVPDEHPMVAVLLFVLINVFFGANCGGFYKCGSLVSRWALVPQPSSRSDFRQYSGFVISNIQFIKCLTLFLAPALVSLLVTNDSDKSQWRTIFLFFSVLIIFVSRPFSFQDIYRKFQSNGLFCYMATDEPAAFTLLSRHDSTGKPENHFKTTVPEFPSKNKEETIIA